MKFAGTVLLTALLLASTPLTAQTFALVSDLNGRYGSTTYHARVSKAIEAIITMQPDAVISAGDMVAGQRQPALDSPKLDSMWDAFNQLAGDPLAAAGIPLAVTPGNHDGSAYPEFALEREHFEQQWQNRRDGLDILPGSEWPWRYAARLGNTLLVSFDGTVPGKLPQREISFIADALKRYRDEAEAVIVVSHLPMWPLARGREREILNDPDLLGLLHRNDVTVYVSGHHHAFYAGRDDKGMIHLAVGALGGNARAYSHSGVKKPHSFTLMKVNGKEVKIESLAAPEFTSGVDAEQIPALLDGPLGILKRLDY